MIGETRQAETPDIEEVFDAAVGKARGILRPPPPAGQFRHVRRSPPADLAPWIDHYWLVQWRLQQPYLQETLPHPNFYLVFENRKSVVSGVSTAKFSRLLRGRSGVFGVKFRPGGFRPFLKMPAARLSNQVIPAQRVFGKDIHALDQVFISASSQEESWHEEGMIAACDAFFRARVPRPSAAAALSDAMVQRIRDQSAIKTVADLAEAAGLEKRKLQRIFREYVGVAPKWVIRRFRLHELVEALHSGKDPDWSQLALELGYFDQAHLINDFKSIVGYSPARYRKAPPSRTGRR